LVFIPAVFFWILISDNESTLMIKDLNFESIREVYITLGFMCYFIIQGFSLLLRSDKAIRRAKNTAGTPKKITFKNKEKNDENDHLGRD
jgi:hypothetical protein